jgi:DNA repair exonuclease SbcCD ATPase subunit
VELVLNMGEPASSSVGLDETSRHADWQFMVSKLGAFTMDLSASSGQSEGEAGIKFDSDILFASPEDGEDSGSSIDLPDSIDLDEEIVHTVRREAVRSEVRRRQNENDIHKTLGTSKQRSQQKGERSRSPFSTRSSNRGNNSGSGGSSSSSSSSSSDGVGSSKRDTSLKPVHSPSDEDVDRLKDLLESADFRKLMCDRGTFDMLRDKAANAHLSLRELVSLRVSEICSHLKSELDHTRTALSDLSLSKETASNALASKQRELTARAGAHGSIEEGYRSEMAALTERCQRLTTALDGERKANRESAERSSRSDALEAENKRLAGLLTSIRGDLERQASLLSASSAAEQQLRKTTADAAKAKELLTLDKHFLEREAQSASDRACAAERHSEDLSSRLRELESKNASMTDQLVSLQLRTREDADSKLDREIVRLREDGVREMEQLRLATKDLQEKEARVLKDAKASLEADLALKSQQLQSAQNELNLLTRQTAAEAAEREARLQATSAELKVKTFQLASQCSASEEALSLRRQADSQVEMMQGQLAIHQAAITALESEAKSEKMLLMGELEVVKARLMAYESLEEKVDAAIVTAGADVTAVATPDVECSLCNRKAEASPGVMALRALQGVPMDQQRRMRQALELATQLRTAEKKINTLETQLAAEADERSKLKYAALP